MQNMQNMQSGDTSGASGDKFSPKNTISITVSEKKLNKKSQEIDMLDKIYNPDGDIISCTFSNDDEDEEQDLLDQLVLTNLILLNLIKFVLLLLSINIFLMTRPENLLLILCLLTARCLKR